MVLLVPYITVTALMLYKSCPGFKTHGVFYTLVNSDLAVHFPPTTYSTRHKLEVEQGAVFSLIPDLQDMGCLLMD